jgi:hypothetical protein
MNPTFLARRGALAAAMVISGCLLLSACSNGSGASSGSSASFRGTPAEDHAAAVPGAAGAGDAGRSAVSTAKLAPAQDIVYTATLTVRAANVTAAAQRAVSIVVAAGGYTADEQATSATPDKTGRQVSLTLKIPVSGYQTVLAQLSSSAIGRQLAMQQQATDVTQQVADVNSLVTSQEAAISALNGLLKKAGSVSGLLDVQQQISDDQSQLNSLLAQQRALDHETSYATVTMTLVGPRAAPVHHKSVHRGFLAGLSGGWRALRHATAWVLTVLGATLPFLIVIVVLAGIGYAGRRRFGRRKAGPTAVR